MEGLFHNVVGDPLDLNVHLKGGNPFLIAGYFKIHIAEGVFSAENIGENDMFFPFENESHRDPRYRALHGDACIHQCETTSADRGHRGGTVRFGDVRLEADDVGEIFRGWQGRAQRAFCQFSVADFATSGSS